MEKKIMKNIEKAKVLNMKELTQYQEGQIVSKTLIQNKSVNITLFAFDKGEEISAHSSDGDAMVNVLDGLAEITIGEQKFKVSAGEIIVMPAGVPRSIGSLENEVYADSCILMILSSHLKYNAAAYYNK